MSNKLADMRHLRFVLNDLLNIEELTQFPYYEDHSQDTIDMALDTAYQLARDVFWPSFQDFDKEGVSFDGTQARPPKAMYEIWKLCKEGGWFTPSADYKYGGQQFPLTVSLACSFLFYCGNMSAAMYLGTTAGAGLLVRDFGSQDLKDTYVEKLFTGEWGGTMALTEPDAGSSLGDMTTSAVKAADGDYYLLKGTKRFITSGDHDLAPNIVHPVLAKIEGAPPGTKGISMFIVPKYRAGTDGVFDTPNDVATAGIEHKLGLKGQSTATLNFGENGECRGWLVGEEGRGLSYMFLLLNHARLHTGVQATAGASTAYQCALQYAHERIQGRDFLNVMDPTSPQVPIIQHPDVRQMLLQQKATVEGNMALLLTCSKYMDTIHAHEDSDTDNEDVQHAQSLLEILTPCCKAHGTDSSFESIRLAIQCFGGAGFCEDYPVAQLLRDNKVFSIYEGTNGIQSLDLLARKIPAKNSASMKALMGEIGTAINAAEQVDELRAMAESVQKLQNEVLETTMQLGVLGMSGEIHAYLCNATAYLEMFSQLVISWQWLLQATRAHELIDSGSEDASFYKGLIETGRFYINWTVPKALATASILKSDERTALNIPPEYLGDVETASLV